jgi:hypothetical protein
VILLRIYSPYFNPIERFWLHLKNLASANRLHSYLADLSAATDQTIAAQTILSTLIASPSPSTFGLTLRPLTQKGPFFRQET